MGRDWDTWVGSIELAVPKLREGSYFPDWLLQPRRRAEQAFVSVIADAYRLCGSRSCHGTTRHYPRFDGFAFVALPC